MSLTGLLIARSTLILLMVLGGILLLGAFLFLILNRAYNRYLNQRLKGETERKNFFSYKAFFSVMAMCLGAFLISSLAISNSNLSNYKHWLEELSPRQHWVSAETIADYSWLTDGAQKLNVPGYTVTKQTDGDFECYIAWAKESVLNSSLMPSCVIYLKYIGNDLDLLVEFKYNYNTSSFGHSVNFEREYLFLSRMLSFMEPYESIDITLRLNDPQLGKDNEPPIYSQSHFVIGNRF